MNTNDLTTRLDQLVSQGQQVMNTRYRNDSFGTEYVSSGAMAGFRSASLSFLQRIFSANHPHVTQFEERTKNNSPACAECGVAILQAAHAEISGGWLFAIKGLVAAELFADFLDMAEHLLKGGYKDPAAVMAGCVLEEHVRQLCAKNHIPLEEDRGGDMVPKKADRLNADLAKAEIYNKLDQKQITAWFDLRNNAAHGKFNEYSNEQVRQMMAGILEFMSRVTT